MNIFNTVEKAKGVPKHIPLIYNFICINNYYILFDIGTFCPIIQNPFFSPTSITSRYTPPTPPLPFVAQVREEDISKNNQDQR